MNGPMPAKAEGTNRKAELRMAASYRRPSGSAALAEAAANYPGAVEAPFPGRLAPMLAMVAERPFSDPDWLFEPKLDGIRALAFLREGRARLVSRNGLDITSAYPEIATEIQRQDASRLVLDGEIVALEMSGRPSFQRLQQRMNLAKENRIARARSEVPVLYYVFDILYLEGYDVTSVSLANRKSLLQKVLKESERLRSLEWFEGEGEIAFRVAVEHGFEGVVAKRRESRYLPGRRSRDWLKLKAALSGDFLVIGYTEGAGERAGSFGSLVLGDWRGGEVAYAGLVGTGFDTPTLRELRQLLERLRVASPPVKKVPGPLRGVTWVRPGLVARVKYVERTRDGSLRAPVFVRLAGIEKQEAGSGKQVEHLSLLTSRFSPVASGFAGLSPGPPGVEGEARQAVEQLQQARGKALLEVEGYRIALSNLDKPFWPPVTGRRAVTKRDFIVYLARVAPYLLGHLAGRPLTLTRFPDGIEGVRFYQKHWEEGLPPFVETVTVYSEHGQSDRRYLMCNNLPTLLWLGQVANLELHCWLSRIDQEPDAVELPRGFTGSIARLRRSVLNHPDFVLFDLDPYIYSGEEPDGGEPELNRRAFQKCCEVAVELKELLDDLSLPAFLKTSGRTGLHLLLPVVRRLDYAQVRSAAGAIARFLLERHPDSLTTEWSVARRTGKLFLDYNQNARGKTIAWAYSPRAVPGASVSMPIRWEELASIYPTDFTIETVPDRLKEMGDPWETILQQKADLAGMLEGDGARK